MEVSAFGEQLVAELTPICGWTFAYNVNADMVVSTVTGSGTVTSDAGRAKLSTGAAINSSAKIETVIPLRYITGQGAMARFTAVFGTPRAGSQQLIGIGSAADGWFFGYNGLSFGIMRRSAGVDTWTPAPGWIDRFDTIEEGEQFTTVNTALGNIYQIRVQWLGYGEQKFYMEDPELGELRLVHRIRYANSSALTSVRNPTLPIMAQVINTTNDADVVLYTPSAMGFVEGKVENPPMPHPFALPRTLAAAKTAITTEAGLLTLKNLATWQSVTNRVRMQLRQLSVGTDGTKNVTIRMTKNTTLGGSPSYANYSANTSPAQYDTAGTTLTGGTRVFSGVMQKTDSKIFDLDSWGIVLAPGETVTISAQSSSGVDVDVAVHWVDLF